MRVIKDKMSETEEVIIKDGTASGYELVVS